jgi:hypothetical protein
MTLHFMNMHWSAEFRYGFGFDIESCSSRPVWVMQEENIVAMSFDGIVLCLPFLIFTIGNVWEDVEDAGADS